MKSIFSFCLFAILTISSAQAQEWINDWFAKNPGLWSKSDSMMTVLRQDFQKAIGTSAPTFTFQHLVDDTVQSLEDFRGNVLLVNFWDPNCSGCRYEMPALSHLQDSLYEKKFRVIFLSPESIKKELLNRYFSEHKLSGTKGVLERIQLKKPYQMFAKPSSFIVDRNGIVRDAWIGPLEFEELVKKIIPCFTIINK